MDLYASEMEKSISSDPPGSRRVPLDPTSLMIDEPPGLSTSRRPVADYRRDLCVHELLSHRAETCFESVAVEFQEVRLTYGELETRSNQLAHFLLAKGVRRETLVGLCVERSELIVVALLGIMKAGGAYVPLDPAYPSDRIKYALDDSRAKLLLTQQSLAASLAGISAEVVCIDAAKSGWQREHPARIAGNVKPNNLAYVIYTSGSTGRPKGVQLEHRSVVNFLCSMVSEPGMTSGDVLLAVTTLSFDIAGLEIYLPLLAGGRLVVAPREATSDGRLLIELMVRSGATIMQATPTTWRLLLESGWQGDPNLKVLVGGEALSADLACQLAKCCGSVWNMYGPTETTIWSSVYRVEGREQKLVPIGKPIANTTFHILDAAKQPVPQGTEGELYISGEGLARGYFERNELTAEKFMADPFDRQPGSRLYRTGDLARFKEDGNVEFLGRIDHQVKIRGFRIELGEIEAVLEQHPAIRQAVVIAREDTPDDKRLVAYLIPHPECSVKPEDLRKHAGRQLPDYMLPSAFVKMVELPLTQNGKVDRKALPAPTASDFESGGDYVAARNAIERKLVRLWEEVLGVNPISVTANFFDLGGHSIIAARLFTKILRTFGKELPLSTLFRSPTVEQLAKELEPSHTVEEYRTLIPIQGKGSRPPFFCVHGGAGSSLFMHQLSRELGDDQPFYGIEPEGLDGKRFLRLSVEEMAAFYIVEIRKVQPTGPFHIGGYCFGGLVAFWMAQQLLEKGEQPALVALFSAELRYNHFVSRPEAPPTTETMGTRLGRWLSSPGKFLRGKSNELYWRTKPAVRRSTYRVLLGLGLRIPPSMRTMHVVQNLFRSEQNYKPKPYQGSMVLFYGPGSVEFGSNLGWDGLANQFEHCVIGDEVVAYRRDIMNDPLVGITAKELAPYLAGQRGASLRTSQ